MTDKGTQFGMLHWGPCVVHTKLPKIQKILDHYADKKIMNGNVVSLDQYRKAMSLE